MLAQRWPEAAQTARRQGAPFVMSGNDGGDALDSIPKLAKQIMPEQEISWSLAKLLCLGG